MSRRIMGALLVAQLVGLALCHRTQNTQVSLSVSPACASCELALRLTSDALCDPGAEDFLVGLVQKELCPSTPDIQQCMELTTAVMPVAIQYIRTALSPAQMCASIGVCSTSPQAHALAVPKFKNPVAKLKDVECGLCEYVVNYVKQEIDDPLEQEQIKESAIKACKALPNEIAASCMDLVINYGTILVAMIDSVDAATSCLLMGMCGSEVMAFKAPPFPVEMIALFSQVQTLKSAAQQANAGPCDVCKLLVLEIHTLLANPSTMATISSYAHSVCKSTGAYEEQCGDYVDMYAPLVVGMLKKYLADPNPLCLAISACPPPSLIERVWENVSHQPLLQSLLFGKAAVAPQLA